jgi:hypothetical protein
MLPNLVLRSLVASPAGKDAAAENVSSFAQALYPVNLLIVSEKLIQVSAPG